MAQSHSKKIAFFGTPDLCLVYLDALIESDYTPSLLVTNPDRPVGRKQSELAASPVKEWGLEKDIEIFQPEKLDDIAFAKLGEEDWDLFIVVAYGKIIPEKFITLPKHGTLNVHYSLLPRWRGATPTEAAILHGDDETGVSIQEMRFKLDSGPVIAWHEIPLEGDETTPELRGTLSSLGAKLLIETLPKYFAGEITPTEQDENAVTTCRLIKKSHGEVKLSDPDIELWRKYRGYYGWPGIFFFDQDGKRVKITDADYQGNTFIIKKVIPEGKKEQGWKS